MIYKYYREGKIKFRYFELYVIFEELNIFNYNFSTVIVGNVIAFRSSS